MALAFIAAIGFGVWDRLIGQVDGRPTPTTSSGLRLSSATMLVPTNPSYAFRATQTNGTPVTFDPCRPIHYVVRPSGSPSGGDAMIADAFERIAAASGLTFVYEGTTAETPIGNRPNYLPDQYGDRWAPVLVAWSTPSEFSRLSGDVIGEASSAPVEVDNGQSAWVSGQVVLDTEQMTHLMKFNGGTPVARAVIIHELGHLVGLSHVMDDRQLMYPSARPLVTNLSSGDITGLAALGKGTCFPNL